jgi:hypothetical protein
MNGKLCGVLGMACGRKGLLNRLGIIIIIYIVVEEPKNTDIVTTCQTRGLQ